MLQRKFDNNENIDWLLNLTNAFSKEEFIVSNMKQLPKQLIDKDIIIQAELFTQCQDTEKFTLQTFQLYPNMLVKENKYLVLSTCFLEKKRISYKEFSVQGVALNNQLGSTYLFFKSYYELSEWQKQLKKFCKMSNFLQKFTLLEKSNSPHIFTCIKNKSKQRFTVSIYKISDFAKAPSTYEQLMNEINILMSLKHPCLLNYVSLYEDVQFTFVLYEYWQGVPLYKLFETGYRFTSIEIAKIIYQLIKFISQLHNQHLYHAQITPQNIFVLQGKQEEEMQIIITNFAFREQNYLLQLRKKLPQQWISSELQLNQNPLPQKLDIFQIGCTMYYLFTYQPSPHTDFSSFQKSVIQFKILPFQQLQQEYEEKSSKIFTVSELDLLLKLLNPISSERKDLNSLTNHHWFVNQIAKSKASVKLQLLPSLRTILEIREQSSIDLKFSKSLEYSKKVSILSMNSSDNEQEEQDLQEEDIDFLDLISQEENHVAQFIKKLNNQLILVRKL